MNVGTLSAKLELVVDSFNKSLDDAHRRLADAGKAMTTYISVPLAGAAAGLLRMAQAQGSWAEELGNLSAATGLSTTRLQELKYVADMTGVSFEGLTGAGVQLQRRLMGMEEGGNIAARVMQDLGVAIKTADGEFRSMDEMLPEIIRKLQEVENPTLRNTMAAQIFGRQFGELAPLLAMSSAELDAMTRAAHESGRVLSEDSVERLQRFDDMIGALQLRLQGFAAQALAAFLALPGPVQGAIAAVAGLVMLAGPLMQAVALFQALRAAVITAALAARAGTISFAGLWTAITGPVGLVLAAIAAVAAGAYLVYRNWDRIKAFFVRLWEGVKAAFRSAAEYLAKLWDALYEATVGRWVRVLRWIWEQVKALGRLLGFGEGNVVPRVAQAGAVAPGGAAAGAAAGSAPARSREDELLAELRQINRNTRREVYA